MPLIVCMCIMCLHPCVHNPFDHGMSHWVWHSAIDVDRLFFCPPETSMWTCNRRSIVTAGVHQYVLRIQYFVSPITSVKILTSQMTAASTKTCVCWGWHCVRFHGILLSLSICCRLTSCQPHVTVCSQGTYWSTSVWRTTKWQIEFILY